MVGAPVHVSDGVTGVRPVGTTHWLPVQLLVGHAHCESLTHCTQVLVAGLQTCVALQAGEHAPPASTPASLPPSLPFEMQRPVASSQTRPSSQTTVAQGERVGPQAPTSAPTRKDAPRADTNRSVAAMGAPYTAGRATTVRGEGPGVVCLRGLLGKTGEPGCVRLRSAMNAPDDVPLDEAFRRAFLRCVKEDDAGALLELERLAGQGATTSAFEDHELGPANFAMAVENVLDRAVHGPAAERFLRAANVVMGAGPAFRTNRAYVGNGGDPAVCFVLRFLSGELPWGKVDKPVPTVALRLLTSMVEHGLELGLNFWRDFVLTLRPLPEPQAAWREVQLQVVELAARQGLLAFDAALQASLFNQQSLYLNPLQRLLSVQRGDVVTSVLERFERDPAFHVALAEAGRLDELAESVLNPFLSSNENRRQLWQFATRFSLVREWLSRPAVVFALVRKKEKSTLRWLLARVPEALKSARDEQGNGLLHELVMVRGKTGGIAELLIEGGLDPHQVNAQGESALDLERRRGRRASSLLAVMNDHASPSTR